MEVPVAQGGSRPGASSVSSRGGATMRLRILSPLSRLEGHAAHIGVMWQAQLVAVVARLPPARWAAAEADAARAKGRVRDAKEQATEEAALHSVVPVVGRGRQRAAPHVARDANVLLVVEVQLLEHVVGAHGAQADREALAARRAVAAAHASEHVVFKRREEALLVLVGRVEHEELPQRLAKDGAHEVGDARV